MPTKPFLLTILVVGLLFPTGPAGASTSYVPPTVVLAEGTGEGPGWVMIDVVVPPMTSIFFDLHARGGTGEIGLSYDLLNPPGHAMRSAGGGSIMNQRALGMGLFLRDGFTGSVLFLFGGGMASHSWRVLTDGPGTAQVHSTGTNVVFLAEEDFTDADPPKAGIHAALSRDASVTFNHGNVGMQITHTLFGRFEIWSGTVCRWVCSNHPGTLIEYARDGASRGLSTGFAALGGNGAGADPHYLLPDQYMFFPNDGHRIGGFSFVAEPSGFYDFRILSHAGITVGPGFLGWVSPSRVFLLAADVPLE